MRNVDWAAKDSDIQDVNWKLLSARGKAASPRTSDNSYNSSEPMFFAVLCVLGPDLSTMLS